MKDEELIRIALECGADKAAVIDAKDIVLNAAYRGMCEDNRCGAYGRCYMCPPDVGPIEELMDRVRGYDRALFYQLIGQLEDSYDIEGMQASRKALTRTGQALLDAIGDSLGPDALHLSAGGCGLCQTCAKVTSEPCRFPDRALASLESYGMDVYQTTKNTPLKYINGANTVTYFGMVLFRVSGHA